MNSLQDILLTFTRLDDPVALIDILLVTALIYGLLYLMRGTPAVQLARGIIVLFIGLYFLISVLPLPAFRWVVTQSIPVLLIAVPVIFQPEIRRGLERLGRTRFLFDWSAVQSDMTRAVQQVARAAKRLSERRHGALIVFERSTGLQELIETGIEIDSSVNTELLLTIFYPKTALHDGAVIIREDRIMAAACVLPLAGEVPDQRMGTRHRAALGVTQQSDALVVVVSEETGVISLAYSGRIIRNLDEGRLTRLLLAFYEPTSPSRGSALFSSRAPSDQTPGENPQNA